LHDSSAAAILRLRFFAGHLFTKCNDPLAFFGPRYRASAFLVFWTTLWVTSAGLAILSAAL
ncbi:MAG TPA: hypothetical protein VND42_06140, partial [Candidatus Acidoferrales bacterium]|nr:hypothetical protein [Candidatus Acidoferrales bacterium]